MLLSDIRLSASRQASIYATGLVTIFTLGTIALVALVCAALWLVVQFVILVFTSLIEAMQSVTQLYTSADPFVKLLVLVAIVVAIWQVVRYLRR